MRSIMWKLARSTVAALTLSLLATSPALAHASSRGRASHTPGRTKRCLAPKHHKVLVNSHHLVMWSVERYGGEFGEDYEETLFACVPPRGKTHIMGGASEGRAVQAGSGVKFESAGSFVAIDEEWGNSVGFSEDLTLHDARDGRSTRIIAFSGENWSVSNTAPESLKVLGPPVGFGIYEYAVGARGDVAWVGGSSANANEAGMAVLYVHDAKGIHRVAASATIELVGFRRGQVRWTESAPA
jgi:hypothetical protein